MSAPPGGQRVKLTSEKMEQLLRPELEEGNITSNDFERTKRFASVNRSYWPPATGIATVGLTVYYAQWFRKRPWSKLSMLLIAPVAYTVGTLPGAAAQVLAFTKFRKELEDPKGLLQALSRKVRVEQGASDQGPEARDSVPLRLEDPLGNVKTDEQGDHQQDSRWAELRKASGSVTNSTWDSIRQSHERAGTSQRPPTGNNVDAEAQDDRQTEQAKFDALLEAERKM